MQIIIERPGEKLLKFIRRGHEDYDKYIYVGSVWQYEDNVGQATVDVQIKDPKNIVFEVRG